MIQPSSLATRPLLDLRPNPGPELVPYTSSDANLWYWLIGAALAVAIVLAVSFRRRPQPLTSLQRFDQTLDVAEADLAHKPVHALLQMERGLRQLLMSEFQFPAERRTAAETIDMLQQEGRIVDPAKASLSELLRDGELAKFGEKQFTAEQVRPHLTALRQWSEHMRAAAETRDQHRAAG